MNPKKILVVAPHPDDETLGVGGAIAKFASEGCEIHVLMVSGHLPPLYTRSEYEVTVKEAKNAFSILGVTSFSFLEIPSTMISNMPLHELNGKISEVFTDFEPNIVFCPYPDRHIDHRLVFDSVMVATRPIGVGK